MALNTQQKEELIALLLNNSNNTDDMGLVLVAQNRLNSDLAVRKVERVKELLNQL